MSRFGAHASTLLRGVVLVAALAMALCACQYHVVGDSTMWQVEQLNGGRGSTLGGCGYTSGAACRIPLTAPEADIVIAGVSVWDTYSDDLSGYQVAHDYYSGLGVPVVWVQVPPTQIPYDDGALTSELIALNAAVGRLLGCDLVPWTFRDPTVHPSGDRGSEDGIHYTLLGASGVTAKLGTLTAADACTPTRIPTVK